MGLSQKNFIKNTSAALGLSLLGSTTSCTKTRKIPNILFIMSDNHAYQANSAYDKTLTDTPNIDRIANKRMRFSNICVTNSICAPSRAVIFMGKYRNLNVKVDNRFPFDDSQDEYPRTHELSRRLENLSGGNGPTNRTNKW